MTTHRLPHSAVMAWLSMLGWWPESKMCVGGARLSYHGSHQHDKHQTMGADKPALLVHGSHTWLWKCWVVQKGCQAVAGRLQVCAGLFCWTGVLGLIGSTKGLISECLAQQRSDVIAAANALGLKVSTFPSQPSKRCC